jgi:hypothetical protein
VICALGAELMPPASSARGAGLSPRARGAPDASGSGATCWVPWRFWARTCVAQETQHAGGFPVGTTIGCFSQTGLVEQSQGPPGWVTQRRGHALL